MKKIITLSSAAFIAAVVLAVGFASVADAQTVGSISSTSYVAYSNTTGLPAGAVAANATSSINAIHAMWSTVWANTDLTIGSGGQNVVNLQNYLASLGFLNGLNYSSGSFDGATLQALAAYQAVVHLPATGYFGPLTRAHLFIALLMRPIGYNIF